MDKIPVWLKAFILSFILLFSVGILIVTLVIQRQHPAVTTMQSEEQERYQAQPEEVFNAMLLFKKDKEMPPDKILLVRVDAYQNQVSLLDVPLDLDSTVNTKTRSLEQYCKLEDIHLLKKAVENLFFIEIQRTVQIEDAGLISCIDYFGGLEWEADQTLNYQELSGNTLRIDSGRQWIDGRRFCAFIRQGDAASLFCALGEQHLHEKLAGNFQKYLTIFSENTESDFTAYDYTFYQKGLVQMLKDHNAGLILPRFEKEETDQRIGLTASSREEIKKAFS